MNRINKNILGNVRVDCKNCAGSGNSEVKLSDWASHIQKCYTVIIDKCIFPSEGEKEAHAENLSWDAWKMHVETECEGIALKCK